MKFQVMLRTSYEFQLNNYIKSLGSSWEILVWGTRASKDETWLLGGNIRISIGISNRISIGISNRISIRISNGIPIRIPGMLTDSRISNNASSGEIHT